VTAGARPQRGRPLLPDALAWPALCAGLALASALVWVGDQSQALAWNAAQWPLHPWMLWSAALAHLSGAHLLLNLAALLVLAVLGASLGASRTAAVAVLLAWPAATAALLFWPQVTGYSGLSGLECAMLAVLALHAAGQRASRPVAWLLLALLVVKLASEQAWSVPIGYDPNWGFNVVYAAHLGGAVAGACAALALEAVRRWRSR